MIITGTISKFTFKFMVDSFKSYRFWLSQFLIIMYVFTIAIDTLVRRKNPQVLIKILYRKIQKLLIY